MAHWGDMVADALLDEDSGLDEFSSMARCEYCGEHGFWESTPAGYRIFTPGGLHQCVQYLRLHRTRLFKSDFAGLGGTVENKQQPPALNLFS